MIQLGMTYKDKITGFTGVCTGICNYISGCNQALLVPKCGEDGTAKDSQWYDVQRLEPMDAPVITLNNDETPGCDRAAPKR